MIRNIKYVVAFQPGFSHKNCEVGYIRVIPKKANIQYINFGDKFDLQIEIVAIFRKKDF